jgi:hypothetical protein
MNSAISHPLRTPDWLALKLMSPESAAPALSHILVAWDRIEEQAFAVRGEAMLLIEERNLFRFIVDNEVGDYYQSFDKWLKDTLPRSWGYCRDALRARKACRSIPFTDFAQMKRCNIEQLARTSEQVRPLPDVVQAAKSLPEKALVEKLNKEHSQHLEVKQPVTMASADDVEEFETAIALAIAVEGCTSRAEAIRAISLNYINEHQVEQTA